MVKGEETLEIHLIDTDIDLAVVKKIRANCGKEFLAVKTVQAQLNDRRICINCLDAHNVPTGQKKQFTYTIVVEDFSK